MTFAATANPVRYLGAEPVFIDSEEQCKCYGGEVAADLFCRGICLPGSSSLSGEDQRRVIEAVESAVQGQRKCCC